MLGPYCFTLAELVTKGHLRPLKRASGAKTLLNVSFRSTERQTPIRAQQPSSGPVIRVSSSQRWRFNPNVSHCSSIFAQAAGRLPAGMRGLPDFNLVFKWRKIVLKGANAHNAGGCRHPAAIRGPAINDFLVRVEAV